MAQRTAKAKEAEAAAEKEAPAKIELAPVGGTPRFSVTLFFYAVVSDVNGENTKRFPAQQTVSADSAEEFTQLLGDFYGSLVEDAGSFVTYEPREIGPQSGGARRAGAAAPQQRAQAPQQTQQADPPYPGGEIPVCPFHGTPITQKFARGTNSYFWSCSQKGPDGRYCNWKPADMQ